LHLFRFILKAYALSLHEVRVHAHMPLWIALYFILPVNTPDWASAANTRSFIVVPFIGFLAPPSKATTSD
jgi:hypothetical protein